MMEEMTSVLDPVRHERLIADLDTVCAISNVPRSYIHKSMLTVCQKVEVDWVTHFHQYREQGCGGLLLLGVGKAMDRCLSISAALLRNFIDARVVVTNTIIEQKQASALVEPTVIVIPNLFVSTKGNAHTSWQIQLMFDMLLSRLAANKPTVMYVQDEAELEAAYGTLFLEHLRSNYMICTEE